MFPNPLFKMIYPESVLLDPLFKMIHPECVLPKSWFKIIHPEGGVLLDPWFKASPSRREHWKKTQKISR